MSTMMIIPMAVMAGLGFFLSLVLVFASHYFYVEEDPVLEAIKVVLPGINCGGCGFAGCEGAAKALMAGKAGIHVCIRACPFHALEKAENGMPQVNPDRCRGCGICSDICPKGVLSVVGNISKLIHLDLAHECLAPCRQKCPAQINIPQFIRQIQRQDYPSALLTIKERNPLVISASRVCHHPTLFESRSQLRGMLRYGLPEYRLPKRVVDWEIGGILNLGIEVKTKCALGSDFSIADLMNKGFKAVFLGLGAWIVPPLCVRGESAHGVTGSLDFLSRAGSDITTLNGVRVAVIGESNTAMDCARTCVRLQADCVTLICPCDDKHMSARKRDVERAVEEGVKIHFLAISSRVCSDLDDQVTAVKYHSMMPAACTPGAPILSAPILSALDKDLSGSVKALEVQLVIAAYEREPDLEYLLHDPTVEGRFRASPKGTLAVDPDASSPTGDGAGNWAKDPDTIAVPGYCWFHNRFPGPGGGCALPSVRYNLL